MLKSEIPRLERVSERNPQKVPGGKHIAKSVSCDVHDREDGRLFHVSAHLTQIKAKSEGPHLVINGVSNIPQVEHKDKDHRICQCAPTSNILLASHTDIDEGPEDQARSEFIE